MTIAERFAANLRHHRTSRDLSQEALALRASLHRTEVGLLERAERTAKIDTLVKLAGALEISPWKLLVGMSWTPGSTTEGRFVETAVPGFDLVTRRIEVERHGGG